MMRVILYNININGVCDAVEPSDPEVALTKFYKVPGVFINGDKMKFLSLAVMAAQSTDIPWEDIGKGVIILVAAIIGLIIFLSLLKRREHKPTVGRTLRGKKYKKS